MSNCDVFDLGLTEYQRAWDLQNRLAAEIARGERPPALLLLEHPHTYTFGRRGQAQNLLWDEQKRAEMGVTVHWVDRGGDVTYHGPGQLVGYPLLRLEGLDHVGYVRSLEKMLIAALARLGLAGLQVSGKTGVWVQAEKLPKPAKIAAIGVKVDAQNITRHGFALNVNPQMEYFSGILPCGLAGDPVTSLAEIFQFPGISVVPPQEPIFPLPPDMEQVKTEVRRAFGEIFRVEFSPKAFDNLT
jgi:lipoate-protein ligase B